MVKKTLAYWTELTNGWKLQITIPYNKMHLTLLTPSMIYLKDANTVADSAYIIAILKKYI